MTKKSIINFISSLLCQLVILGFGLVVPKFIVSNLGSESNGFLSTINQIFVYISLVEAGLGTALLNSLYDPIHNGDFFTVSGLLSSASKKYRKASIIYLVVSVIVGLLYPAFLKSSSIDYFDMSLSIIVFGIGGASSMMLSSTIMQYLVASGKGYVKQYIHLGAYVVTSIFKIIAIILSNNIIIVCAAYSIICVLKGLYI